MAHKILQYQYVQKVFVAPGNGGTAVESSRCENVNIAIHNISALVEFAKREDIHMIFIGPEQPLVDGIVDAFQSVGVNIPCFGPSAAASVLEASKAWSKNFMQKHGIPTAQFGSFSEFSSAKAFIVEIMSKGVQRVVVKASGLAAGKGVLLPATQEEAILYCRQMLEENLFGSSGREIVIEEYLDGEEVSILAFVDGITARAMPPAQDHKRIFDNDRGPNTGGMGAYAPSSVISPMMYDLCCDILKRTVKAMAEEGCPYHGILYGGFILTPDRGPMVLEYNCRFGDPEAQVLLPLLETDLCEVALACIEGRLAALDAMGGLVFQKDTYACTVVAAAPGYPDTYSKGAIVKGLAPSSNNATKNCTKVYHGGTTQDSLTGNIVTSGGRVLAVTGIASTLAQAVEHAYTQISDITFAGMHYRRDIAQRGLQKPLLRLAVLGSTRGSSLQPIIDAIQQPNGALYGQATIECVLCNHPETEDNILGRARRHHIPGIHVPMTTWKFDSSVQAYKECKKTRLQYDREVVDLIQHANADLVLCIGYMRILSHIFVDAFPMRCLNVHPSLLPDFAGGMDLEVHRAVLASGKLESGCTVHFVTKDIDGGPIAVQLRVPVFVEDTPETLKARILPEEGQALIQAIKLFAAGVIGPNQVQEPHPTMIAMSPQSALRLPREVISYRQAGVDIDAGEALVDRIKPYCRSTKRAGCDVFAANEEMLGGFGGLFDLSKAGYLAEDTVLVSGTDGVGTKLKIAHSIGRHDTIGIDLVAMSVNDILVCGAEPLFFLDYFATGKLDVDIAASVVSGIAEGCRQAGCALIGGETAEMAGMYHSGEYDLAGFALGAVRRAHILPRTREIAAGDVLLGLVSSGVHSNGYSLVRKCVEKSGLSWASPAPFCATDTTQRTITLGEALLTPTRIYVPTLLPLIRRGLLKGMAHITGGGLLDNVPRILPDHLCAVVDIAQAGWSLPPVFSWLQAIANLPQSELLRTFNNGLGMVLLVSPELEAQVTQALISEYNEPVVYRLGQLYEYTDPVLKAFTFDTDDGAVKVSGELH